MYGKGFVLISIMQVKLKDDWACVENNKVPAEWAGTPGSKERKEKDNQTKYERKG